MFDFGRVTNVDWTEIQPQRGRNSLNDGPLPDTGGGRGITQDGHAFHARRNLFEKFRPFATQAVVKLGKSGSISARAGETRHGPSTEGIDGLREHDRYRAAYCLDRFHLRHASGED